MKTFAIRNFFEFATAKTHPMLSIVYENQILLRQSQLGRIVEFKNTHPVFNNIDSDVVNVTQLEVQLSQGSQIDHWNVD